MKLTFLDSPKIKLRTTILIFISLLYLGCRTPVSEEERELLVSKSEIIFDNNSINTEQTLEIQNSGVININWKTISPSWLSISPDSGVLNPNQTEALRVSIVKDSIDYGSFKDSLTISSTYGDNYVTISGNYLFTTEGAFWQVVETPINGDIHDIQFINPMEGWAMASRFLLKSIDGGKSWSIQKQHEAESYFSSMHFLNKSLGWIVSNDSLVLKTSNGGNNWKQYSIPEASFRNKIHFISESVGWIAGYGSGFFKSTDGGKSWVKKFDLPDYERPVSIFFLNEQYGWISCY